MRKWYVSLVLCGHRQNAALRSAIDFSAIDFRALAYGYKGLKMAIHCCPGDDFSIARSRLMARLLSPVLEFFDLNCFPPEATLGRPLGYRFRFP
jgi:hypothetical protein